MALTPLSFMDSLVAEPTGVVRLRDKPVARLLVWQPEAIGWIFRSDRVMRHPGSRTLRPILGSRSLIWADGPRHIAYRAALNPCLRGRHLKSYEDIIARMTGEAIENLLPAKEIRLPMWTRRLTLRIISLILLGEADDDLLDTFTAWIEAELGSRGALLARRYLGDGAPRPHRGLDEMLVRSARTARKPALAALLLDEAGLGPIDDAELRDQLVTLLFAGHETTASAIAWTLLWLHRDREVLADVLDELAGTTGDGTDPADLPLLDAAIHESLRLSPPATLAGNRMPTADTELGGRALSAGSILTPCVYLAHRHPDRFADPLRFAPGRFLGGRVSPSHYFPFGGGIRHCLGRDLALLEIRMIVAALLRRVRLDFAGPKAKPQLRGAAMAPHQTLRVAVGVRVPVR
jgi:cytochrome P450